MENALFVMLEYSQNVLSDQGGFGVPGVLRCDRSLSLEWSEELCDWKTGMGKQIRARLHEKGGRIPCGFVFVGFSVRFGCET